MGRSLKAKTTLLKSYCLFESLRSQLVFQDRIQGKITF